MTTRTIATITAEDIDQHREALCEWAKANGIEPENVAASPGLTVERVGRRTVIVYHEFQRDARGWLQLDPDTPDKAWTVKRSTPLRVPLPDLGLEDDSHTESRSPRGEPPS